MEDYPKNVEVRGDRHPAMTPCCASEQIGSRRRAGKQLLLIYGVRKGRRIIVTPFAEAQRRRVGTNPCHLRASGRDAEPS